MNDLPVAVRQGSHAAIDVLAFRLVKHGEAAVVVVNNGAEPIRYFVDRTEWGIAEIDQVGLFYRE